jgi:hypothetical protein
MKTNMNIAFSALAAMLTFSFGCKGQQPEPFDGTPTATAAVVPMDLGLGTYLSGSPSPIAYDLGSRFELTVTKEQLRAAKTIYDIVPGDPKQEIVSYSSVSIRTYVDEKQSDIVALGSDPVLDQAQLALLWSLPYSSNFLIRANSRRRTLPREPHAATTPHRISPSFRSMKPRTAWAWKP